MKRFGGFWMLWLALAWPAAACQYRLDVALDAFFGADAGHAVVFVGEALAVAHDGADADRRRIAFRPVEILWGRYDAALPVQISRFDTRARCEEFGPPFAPAPGSHWLIFGKVVDGVIVPDRVLSHEVRDGEVDPRVRELLKRYPSPPGRRHGDGGRATR